jgi:hypothetical protein
MTAVFTEQDLTCVRVLLELGEELRDVLELCGTSRRRFSSFEAAVETASDSTSRLASKSKGRSAADEKNTEG